MKFKVDLLFLKSENLGIEGTYLSIIKAMHDKLTSNSLHNREKKSESIFSKI